LITLLYWDAMEEEGIYGFKDTLHGKFLARERDAVFLGLASGNNLFGNV
jgi:hypothetical protein